MLVHGCFLWVLVPGCWSLGIDPWVLVPECWSLGVDPWVLVPGCWSLVVDPWVLVPGWWSLGVYPLVLIPGYQSWVKVYEWWSPGCYSLGVCPWVTIPASLFQVSGCVGPHLSFLAIGPRNYFQYTSPRYVSLGIFLLMLILGCRNPWVCVGWEPFHGLRLQLRTWCLLHTHVTPARLVGLINGGLFWEGFIVPSARHVRENVGNRTWLQVTSQYQQRESNVSVLRSVEWGETVLCLNAVKLHLNIEFTWKLNTLFVLFHKHIC